MERVELLLQLIFLGLFITRVQGRCLVEEREALLNFKQTLVDPYDFLHSWELDEDCCIWKGVVCNNTTGHIIKLDLSWSSFDFNDKTFNDKEGRFYATSLAPSLFHLQHLQYLSLHGIYFSQTSIPKFINSLTNLRYLDLSYSGFAGLIPPHLGNLTKLQHLDLSLNDGLIDMSLDMWLFRLKHLQYLNLGEVHLKQTNILQKIDSLNSLRYLFLHDSGLKGVIPPHIGNLTNLCSLDLSSNSLIASNLLWLSRLFALQFLDMSNVNLMFATNWLCDIKLLPALSTLSLSFCNLQTLPTYYPYSNFSSTITSFDLSFNHLNGNLPNWLRQFKRLNSLYLQSNNFTGPISSSLLCNLMDLDLSENNFTELIDDGTTIRCKEYKIISMSISSNQLTGSIPEWIGQMRQLEWLDLGNNQFRGSIPESFGQLINLISLDIRSNLLNGSISEINFGNLSQLKYLYLSDNLLNFNMISFNWIPPFQVSSLFLSSCIIGPHFPLWLQNQKSLSILDLSNSGISDIIPSWFWNISSQMNYLNMSHNAIRGELPMLLNIALAATIDLKSNLLKGHLPWPSNYVHFASFSNNKFSSGIDLYLNGNMSLLVILDLSQNDLFGGIPDSICHMPSLILLDLSHNNLSGEIPKCYGNFSSFMTLKFISIADNNIWGPIPQWMGNLPMLLSLHLSDNNLQGEMPYFKNSRILITFDVGENNLTGNIPIWIGDNLFSLKILRLRSNKFQGLIPSELSKLKGLQILDLANNFLSGPLPKSLKFLKAMTTRIKRLEPLSPIIIPNEGLGLSITQYLPILPGIALPDSLIIDMKGIDREFTNILSLVIIMDFSCNNLIGEVPIELMSLVGLISLNLSTNQFTGQIPINIDDMQSLESLDLSWNHFVGEIPESIVNLSGLNFLNVSYNQLSGRIPMGTQLDTFNESSYYGNPKLCGKPLVKTCENDEHNGGTNSNDDDGDENIDLFLGMVLGFVVGYCSVLGILLLKRSWAIAYFQLYDNIINNIYVFIIVKKNRWFSR